MTLPTFTPTGGVLYVVPTPIGNLGDITLRALDILKQADLIIAEDTRTLIHLLGKYGIPAPATLSYREQVHHKMFPKVKEWLTRKQVVVLTTDAGTPGISDPGIVLINALQQDHYLVEVLPGANAVTTALVQSGLPTDHFQFIGFLPRKQGKVKQLVDHTHKIHALLPTTFVAYESSHRIQDSMEAIWDGFSLIADAQRKEARQGKHAPAQSDWELNPEVQNMIKKLKQEAARIQRNDKDRQGGLQIRVARELTKQFQEVTGVDLSFDLAASRQRFTQWLSDLTIKGEYVVLLRWQTRLQDLAVSDED